MTRHITNRLRSFFPLALAMGIDPGAAYAGACGFSPQPLDLSFGVLGVNDLKGAATAGGFTETCQPGLQTDFIGVCVRFGGGGGTSRTMRHSSGKYFIAYELTHQDRTPWLGDAETRFESRPYDRTIGAAVAQTVYARIISGTDNLPAGVYTDIVEGGVIAAGANGPYDGVSNVCQIGLPPSEAIDLRVMATLQPSCSVTASDMVFPGNLSTHAGVAATATINVLCTNETLYSVGLSAGGGGSVDARRMRGPNGETIAYNLYQDPGHSKVWGDAGGAIDANGGPKNGRGLGQRQSLTVYGLAPPQQLPSPGTYSDSLSVTLSY